MTDPHVEWLAELREVRGRLADEYPDDDLLDRQAALEDLIVATPIATREGARAVAEMIVDGHQLVSPEMLALEPEDRAGDVLARWVLRNGGEEAVSLQNATKPGCLPGERT